MKSPSVPKLPPFEAPTLVFALFAVWSVVAYRASSPGYLLPAVLVALTAHLANKINRALRPLSKLELLPPDLPCNVARVESWLRARDQDEAPLEPGAESAVTWAVEEAKPTELCVVYLHGWGASPPELSPVPEQLAACATVGSAQSARAIKRRKLRHTARLQCLHPLSRIYQSSRRTARERCRPQALRR